MRTFAFICDACGNSAEEQREQPRRSHLGLICKICGRRMRRDFKTEQGCQRSGEKPDLAPSDALGVLPSDVKRANEYYSKRGFRSRFLDDGRCIVAGGEYSRFMRERFGEEGAHQTKVHR